MDAFHGGVCVHDWYDSGTTLQTTECCFGLCPGCLGAMKLQAAFETLRTEPDDAKALGLWRAGVLVSDCLAEAVVLYGFVLHTLGGSNKEAAPFFVEGMAVMVIWWPREP